MKFDIPKVVYIRWQAALAVLEDLQEDVSAPFNMRRWADDEIVWEKKNGCDTPACFAGYLSVAPYCRKLGFPKDDYGSRATSWLMGDNFTYDSSQEIFNELFHWEINEGSRAKTLALLKRRLKAIFKESTGKALVAPLIFYVD